MSRMGEYVLESQDFDSQEREPRRRSGGTSNGAGCAVRAWLQIQRAGRRYARVVRVGFDQLQRIAKLLRFITHFQHITKEHT